MIGIDPVIGQLPQAHGNCRMGDAFLLHTLSHAQLYAAGEARFDEAVVGPDGAGYRWDVRDAAHRRFSVAPPPPEVKS